jgi:putative transposase
MGVSEASECPKGYRFPKSIISYAVYLYHRFLLSYRDVQELLFERGVDVSHETVRTWCGRFSPDIAEALWHRKPRRGRSWHLDEMRVALGGVARWLWRAINEQGEVLDVLLQKERDTGAAKRFFRRLLDDQDLPERIVTDGLRSYGAALRDIPELGASEHVMVSAAERQNNLIEQSHRPTREQERQQRGFRESGRTQRFLFTHAEVANLFRYTRADVPAWLRRRNWLRAFGLWAELSLSIP